MLGTALLRMPEKWNLPRLMSRGGPDDQHRTRQPDSRSSAPAHENTVGIALLEKALVDQGFKNAVVANGEKVGIGVEVVERNPAQTGFVPQAKRWVVERAYGILMLHRRLVRDYEHLPRSSQSRVDWAMTAVILRRLTGATTPVRRTA